MADQTLASLTAATPSTGGLLYGTQSGADRKFTLSAAGAALAEAANAAAQRTALGLDTAALLGVANNFTAAQTISGAALTLSGDQSAPAWTTTGIRLMGSAGTLTDTTSAGTVATAYTNRMTGNTIAATNATTFTNYVTSYHNSPTAGTNVTFGQRWGLGTDLMLVNGNGAASQPALALTGTPFTGGSATTTKPLFSIEPTGTTSTGWATTGTMFGVNAASGFGGNLVDFQSNGVTRFKVDSTGVTTIGSSVIAGSGNVLNLVSAFGTCPIVIGGGGSFVVGATVSCGNLYTTGLTLGADLFLNRKGAAQLQLGYDGAGVIDQLFTAASRITSDGVGANLTIAAGNGRGGAGGELRLSHYTTAGAATIGTLTTALRLTTTGAIILASLPTSDPGVSGQLYKSAGVVMQSA